MATRNDVKKAQAEAAAAAAAAEAEKARSRVREAEIAAQQERIRHDAALAKTKAARAGIDRAISVGVNVGLPLAGMALGKRMAKGIELRHLRTLRADNRQLAGLADSARKVRGGKNAATTLAGIVAAADKLKLGGRMKGPLGLTSAAVLLGEGALSRFVIAPKVENEAAREVLSAVGTASAFAATSLVGSRMVANATPRMISSAAHLAVIDGARSKLLATKGGAAALAAAKAMAVPTAAKVGLRLAARALPVVGWGIMAGGAALGAVQAYRHGGTAKDIAVNAARGFIGLDAKVPGSGEARLASARRLLARNAAYVQRPVRRAAARASAPSSDGMTKGYVRQQAGKSVTVKSYQTPKR